MKPYVNPLNRCEWHLDHLLRENTSIPWWSETLVRDEFTRAAAWSHLREVFIAAQEVLNEKSVEK